MILRIVINKQQKLPNGAVEALQREAARRLHRRWPELTIEVMRGLNNEVVVRRTTDSDKEAILEFVQEIWEDPDAWMPVT
ncbi:DinI-like family protein [Aeromonas rivuli]|uniref:DinI-like family protein n=1 Tax=Aeromonas rivuli TaxID=648794 RepID=UPI0005A9C809|nr:DinI-like family protein [Aeromonas rivuli]